MPSALTDADQDASLREAEFRQPAPPPIPVRKRYYITECETCAWAGSSEQCGSYDDSMSCPVCCSEMCGDEPDEAEIAKHGEAVMQRITSAEARATAAEDKLRDREARINALENALDAADYLADRYCAAWQGKTVRDLAEAEASYGSASRALARLTIAQSRAALASTEPHASSEEATDAQ